MGDRSYLSQVIRIYMQDGQQLPILTIIAKNRAADVVEGFAAGANDSIPKHLCKAEGETCLSSYLQMVRSARAMQHFHPLEIMRLLGYGHVASAASRHALTGPERWQWRRLGAVRLKGRQASMELFELLDLDPPGSRKNGHKGYLRYRASSLPEYRLRDGPPALEEAGARHSLG